MNWTLISILYGIGIVGWLIVFFAMRVHARRREGRDLPPVIESLEFSEAVLLLIGLALWPVVVVVFLLVVLVEMLFTELPNWLGGRYPRGGIDE